MYLSSLLISIYPALVQTLQLAVTGVIIAGCTHILYSTVSSLCDATKSSMSLNRDTTAYYWVKDWLQDQLVSASTTTEHQTSGRRFIYPPLMFNNVIPPRDVPALNLWRWFLTCSQRSLQLFQGYGEQVWPSGHDGMRHREIFVKAASCPWSINRVSSGIDEDKVGKSPSGSKEGVEGLNMEPTWEIFSQPAKTHYFRFQGHLIRVTPSRTVGAYSDTVDWLTFSAHFAPREIWSDLLQTAYTHSRLLLKTHIETYRHRSTSYSNPGRWQPGPKRPHRPWSSVILASHVKDGVLEDCKSFLKSARFYQDRGLPYRRGYLLYGSPGTGKTSLISALASQLSLPIYIIDLSGKDMDDTTLQILINECPARCIILIEDIDCAFPIQRNSDETIPTVPALPTPARLRADLDRPKSSVTLSGLLNALDGVATAEGRLLFCTTNHIEKIDPALSRPGIRDVFQHFYNPVKMTNVDGEPSGLEALVEKTSLSPLGIDKHIVTLSDDFAAKVPADTVSVSAVQAYLMRWKDRPEDAVRHVEEWVDGDYSQDPTVRFVAQ